MKIGMILYVIGATDPDNELEIEEAAKRLDLKADRVETVFGGVHNFDVMDAWWLLTVKGMQKIVCMIAEVTDKAGLRLTGQELRLCG